ncbi:MAG: leucine-rich repeat domain-containing protein, partial [Clostridia bacterium]|nr:leucine-rich repeat domain-containing protein [Clostridia bacterium]
MKKIFKRTLAVLLAAVMVLGAAPLSGFVGLELPKINGLEKLSASVSEFFGGFALKAEAATEYTEGYYTYTVDNNGNAKIKDVDTSISGSITIPSTLGGYSVKSIDYRAFQDCTKMTSINLTGITELGWEVFSGCTSLTSITIPKTLTDCSSPFRGSSIKTAVVEAGIENIPDSLFSGCTTLTS